MNGEKHCSIRDLEQLETYLNEYVKEEGMFHAEINEEVREILNFSAEELKSLSASDLYIASCLITTYSTYVSYRLGHHNSILKWCVNIINKLVAKQASQYDKYMKYEQKKELIIMEDSFAVKVDQARQHAEYKVEMIKEKLHDLRSYSDRLERLGRIRNYDSSR